MKNGFTIVNTARGDLIDEEAIDQGVGRGQGVECWFGLFLIMSRKLMRGCWGVRRWWVVRMLGLLLWRRW